MQDQNIQENQQDKPNNEVVIVPFIEENIPLPRNAREALPSMKKLRQPQKMLKKLRI